MQIEVRTECQFTHTFWLYSKAMIGDQLYASSGFSAEGNIKHFWYNQTMATDYLHTAHCVKKNKQSTDPGLKFPFWSTMSREKMIP